MAIIRLRPIVYFCPSVRLVVEAWLDRSANQSIESAHHIHVCWLYDLPRRPTLSLRAYPLKHRSFCPVPYTSCVFWRRGVSCRYLPTVIAYTGKPSVTWYACMWRHDGTCRRICCSRLHSGDKRTCAHRPVEAVGRSAVQVTGRALAFCAGRPHSALYVSWISTSMDIKCCLVMHHNDCGLQLASLRLMYNMTTQGPHYCLAVLFHSHCVL